MDWAKRSAFRGQSILYMSGIMGQNQEKLVIPHLLDRVYSTGLAKPAKID